MIDEATTNGKMTRSGSRQDFRSTASAPETLEEAVDSNEIQFRITEPRAVRHRVSHRTRPLTRRGSQINETPDEFRYAAIDPNVAKQTKHSTQPTENQREPS